MANVHGTKGNDLIDGLDGVTSGADQIVAYAGSDWIWGLGGDDTIYGLDDNDTIFGGSGNDILKGGGGADELDGESGVDEASYSDSTSGVTVSLITGTGTGGTAEGDTLTSIERLTGSAHDDVLIGHDGTSQHNVLTGLGGNDILKGYGGDDTLQGGGGADTIDGGSGFNTAVYTGSPEGVVVSLIGDSAGNGDAEGDELNGIESLIGSAHADTLWGNDSGNTLRGMNGNDSLKGFGGNDSLWGEDGNDFLHGMDGADTLNGGSGDDTMSGGIGDDTYYVDNANDSVTESGSQGLDQVITSVSWTLTAGADVETLATYSGLGPTAINLTGNSSGNIVRGNNGDNVLNGGDGNDELTSFGGADSFLFNTPLSAAFNADVITDFTVADDVILLDQTIFSSSFGLGSVAGSQFVIGTAALDAGDRIIYDSATGAVLYDSDGTGATAAIQFAEVDAGLSLTNFDFFVVA
jgi:Ca2+-binding RTX toxin-like protein